MSEPQVIATCREIVAGHSFQEVDGMLLDVLTAKLLVQVYESCNPTQREKFTALPLEKMVRVSWNMVK